jgi:hypothetical protein
MKRVWVVFIAFLFLAPSLSRADFELDRKIPAPVSFGGTQAYKVTGLGWRNVVPAELFVTTQGLDLSDWHSYVHLVRASDGHVLAEDEFTFTPPHCGAMSPYLTSGDLISGESSDDYVVGDECGEIMWITFNPDTLYMWDSADPPDIGEPSGLIYRGDTLYIVDSDSLQLLVVQVDGYNVLGRYDLPCTNPSAVAMFDGNLFILCKSDSTHIWEMTTSGDIVATHTIHGLYGCTPQSAAFVGNELYVGGALDSILVFKQYDYSVPVVPGDSVTVEVVPDLVDITFDGVLDPGYVNADVFDEDPCPAPPGVDFVSDFYHIMTTSALENVSRITVSDTTLGNEIDLDKLRVFVRPSVPCQLWRDITVDSAEVTALSRSGKRLSEDDEFSIFALAADNRNQYAVVEFKFDDLEGHLNSAQDSMPQEAYNELHDLLVESHELFAIGHYATSARRADSIAAVVRSYPTIPKIFDPNDPGRNIAGRLISRAHTLAFSIRFYPGWLAGTGPISAVPMAMLEVWPNPSGADTGIRFAPSGTGKVSIDVYSPTGRKVRSLFDGPSGGGFISIRWDGRNQDDRRVAPGVYFVVALEGHRTWTEKVLVQK